MKKISTFAKQIENLHTELLNSIKAEISKVEWETERTKSLVFGKPMPHFDFERGIMSIHEISSITEDKTSLCYHYTTDGTDRMFKGELWAKPNEGLNLLLEIAKYLQYTDIYGGHILRYDSPSEKLGLMWEREKKQDD